MNIHRLTIDEALRQVASRPEGLGASEAAERRARVNARLRKPGGGGAWSLILNQFRSPLVILLLVAMTLSLFLGDRMDVIIVLSVAASSRKVVPCSAKVRPSRCRSLHSLGEKGRRSRVADPRNRMP